MSRSTLLAKLRRIDVGEAAPALPAEVPSFPSFEDPAARFARELQSVGGVFVDGRGDGPDLAGALSKALQAAGGAEIYWECEEVFRRHPLPFRLRDPLAFQDRHLLFTRHARGEVRFPLLLHSRPYRREALGSIAVSVSSAAWGSAETGTVALETGPSKGRLLTMLPPVHVSLLSAKRLLMNAVEFFAAAPPGERGSLTTLVTGPSRTADIEKTLVIGVHGPGKWFVVLTD